MKAAVLGVENAATRSVEALMRSFGELEEIAKVRSEQALAKAIWSGYSLAILFPQREELDITSLVRELKRSSAGRTRVMLIFDQIGSSLIKEAGRAGADVILTMTDDLDAWKLGLKAVVSGKRFVCPAAADAALQPEDSTFQQLTARERSVLTQIALGRTSKEAAEVLDISIKTLETHRVNLGRKLGRPNRAQLVSLALKLGLVSESQLRIAA